MERERRWLRGGEPAESEGEGAREGARVGVTVGDGVTDMGRGRQRWEA